jgi:hypothetical protein
MPATRSASGQGKAGASANAGVPAKAGVQKAAKVGGRRVTQRKPKRKPAAPELTEERKLLLQVLARVGTLEAEALASRERENELLTMVRQSHAGLRVIHEENKAVHEENVRLAQLATDMSGLSPGAARCYACGLAVNAELPEGADPDATLPMVAIPLGGSAKAYVCKHCAHTHARCDTCLRHPDEVGAVGVDPDSDRLIVNYELKCVHQARICASCAEAPEQGPHLYSPASPRITPEPEPEPQ